MFLISGGFNESLRLRGKTYYLFGRIRVWKNYVVQRLQCVWLRAKVREKISYIVKLTKYGTVRGFFFFFFVEKMQDN